MAWTDDLSLMNTDVLDNLGRAVTVYANPVGTEGTLTGTDGSTWDDTDTVTAVCHPAVSAARTGFGGAGAIVETRQFDFALSDLADVCSASGGTPQPGRFAIEDPSDGGTQWWYAGRIEIDGDQNACRMYCTRGAGHNTEAA